MDLAVDRKLVAKETGGRVFVFMSAGLLCGAEYSKMLHDLDISVKFQRVPCSRRWQLSRNGRERFWMKSQGSRGFRAAGHGLLVLTGGPGTGKTTTINTMISYFESEGLSVMLGAPTGRAAKRMTEATGCEAKTLHRLLEVASVTENGADRGSFARNQENPLEADVVIIDEMSMVDIYLMHSLLLALVPGTRLIMQGDWNQLPLCGAWKCLKTL